MSISEVKEMNYVVTFLFTQSEHLVFKSILSLSDVVIRYTLVKEHNVSQM